MKFFDTFNILNDIYGFLAVGLPPTLKAILREPTLLFHPATISRIFMQSIWIIAGDGIDDNGNVPKKQLITPNATGVVLDIGAGHGHTIPYLDFSKVTKYIAVEPNTLMHPHIRERATKAGFHESDGTLLILPYGAENVSSILSALSNFSPQSPQVDTLICVLTLCTIPSPQTSLHALVKGTLKPGGLFLFYEHVLHPTLEDVRWWQRFWTPVWVYVMDGCRLDRDTGGWVDAMGVEGEMPASDGAEPMWKGKLTWRKQGEPEGTLFPQVAGKYVKR